MGEVRHQSVVGWRDRGADGQETKQMTPLDECWTDSSIHEQLTAQRERERESTNRQSKPCLKQSTHIDDLVLLQLYCTK